MSTTNPSIPSPDGTCHLLRLPFELRNKIYDYALSEEDGIGYLEDKSYVGRLVHLASSTTPTDDPRTSTRKFVKSEHIARCGKIELVLANQLQFVNRQLRMETRGLGLARNDLTILLPNRYNTIITFPRLVQCLSARQKKVLRNITLDQSVELPRQLLSDSFYLDAFETILDFARTHPNVKISLPAPHLQPEFGARFVFQVSAAILAARKEEPYMSRFLLPCVFDFVKTRMDDIQRASFWRSCFRGGVPENIRLFPWGEFDEAKTREELENIPCRDDAAWNEWLDAIGEIYENGF
ncbi:hypothetical protein CC80DRAFT_541579 [Byssothecium circinans]|uniref:Uncharacterized protein n=1 Tax=Byssothecium circinans TaxID=147558 RepID=A0A6A5UIP2_9PLEO|nr:hypothetical protein CC80DRAFT_541579 [Byssothecium circinans]